MKNTLLILSILATLAGSSYGQAMLKVTMLLDPRVKQGHMETGVNIPDSHGLTPMMRAIKAGDADVVKFLLENGVDMSATDAHGQTLLQMAVKTDNAAIIALLEDYLAANKNPAEYYKNRPQSRLFLAGGDGQMGTPRFVLKEMLEVDVRDSDGNMMPGAPVVFSIPPGKGGAGFMVTDVSPPSSTVVVHADQGGHAAVYFQLPDKPSVKTRITVTAGIGKKAAKLFFTALTNDGVHGGTATPFDLTGVQASLQDDGSVDMLWEGHISDPKLYIVHVMICAPDGEWKTIYDLPGTYTSAHIPADALSGKLPLPPPSLPTR